MKNIILKNFIQLALLLLIMSCQDQSRVASPNPHNYSLTIIEDSNGPYYADGCDGSDCAGDNNPINLIAELKDNGQPLSDKQLSITTDGADGSIYINTGNSNVLFNPSDHKTNTNGRLEFNFWDEGESGNVNINLSYSDGDTTISTIETYSLSLYTTLADTLFAYSIGDTAVIAGDNSYVELFAKVADNGGMPLANIPILFSKDTFLGTFFNESNSVNPELALTNSIGEASIRYRIDDPNVNLESVTLSAQINISDGNTFKSDIHFPVYKDNSRFVNMLQVWRVPSSSESDDNITVTSIDSIFARALTNSGTPVSDVDIAFSLANPEYGWIISPDSSDVTNETGLGYTIFHPNQMAIPESITNTSVTVSIPNQNLEQTVQIPLYSGSQSAEYIENNVDRFEFWPTSDYYIHLLGDNTNFSVVAIDSSGTGISNVPVYFSLKSSTGNPTGMISTGFSYTGDSNMGSTDSGGDAGSNGDDNTGSSDNGLVSENILAGMASVTYYNIVGGADSIFASIRDPENLDSVLFEISNPIITNQVTQLIGEADYESQINNLDSLETYTAELTVTALDTWGIALENVDVFFEIFSSDIPGYIVVTQDSTGTTSNQLDGPKARANFYLDTQEIHSLNESMNVQIEVSTYLSAIKDTINLIYTDALPVCPDCIAELILTSDAYILSDANPQANITATMTDSLGNDPDDNTYIQFQAVQENEDGDLVSAGSISPYGYFLDYDGDGDKEANGVYDITDAAGQITVIGTSEGLADTIYFNILSSTPSFIQILDPYPNEIMVQGGGGLESTDLNVEIKDGNGNLVTEPYWVRFTIIGAPEGAHFNGESGIQTIDIASLGGVATVSLNSGTRPGSVQLQVELYPRDLNDQDYGQLSESDCNDIDNSIWYGQSGIDETAYCGDGDLNEIFTSNGFLAYAEGIPVAIATGPPAEGVINYSYVDIATIGGGLYQVPVTVDLWDIHSNPVTDSTNVYFSIRGITSNYDPDAAYFNGDKIFWGANAEADSLVYECIAPFNANASISFLCQSTPDATGAGSAFIGNGPDGFAPQVWEALDHPANIEPVAKTGNLSPSGDSYPGTAWTNVKFSSSTIFDETYIRAHTWGSLDEQGLPIELIIDSRANHDGGFLALPLTLEGNIGAAVNPNIGCLDADGLPGCATEVFVNVTGSIIDYYQYYIDNGTLGLSVQGGTVIAACDAIDSNGDGFTGTCFDDVNFSGIQDTGENTLPYFTCSDCGDNGGFWQFSDNDVPANSQFECLAAAGIWYGSELQWCGDGISDDNPIYGISNSDGVVNWVVRYDLGINQCENCGEDNAQCEDYESNIQVQLLDPQGGASDAIQVTLIQPNPETGGGAFCP